MGLPRLKGECPWGGCGVRRIPFWINGGSGPGWWSVGRKGGWEEKCGRKGERKRERWVGAEYNFVLLHLALSEQNHLAEPKRSGECEHRKKREIGRGQ